MRFFRLVASKGKMSVGSNKMEVSKVVDRKPQLCTGTIKLARPRPIKPKSAAPKNLYMVILFIL